MAFGLVLNLPFSCPQLSSSKSPTCFAGITSVPVTIRVVGKKNFQRRCIGDKNTPSLTPNTPVTQWSEQAFKTEGAPQVGDLKEIKQQIEEIKEFLHSIDDGDLSISAYDTAWVAMVRDIHRNNVPLFPTSLDWIINNQLPDGSWGEQHFFSAYDRLNSTLACVVALKTWNINPEGCEKGVSFLRQNLHKIKDEDPEHLMIFIVTFPSLLEMAQKVGLQVFQDSNEIVQDLYAKRDLHLKRIPKEILHNVPTRLLYTLEGLPDLDWGKLLKLQHPNGSFLCSPSSTAYALMETEDENCFKYLSEIVQRFNGGVPHSYPMDLFEHLWVVDRLERLGFSRYFKSEIRGYLDHVYRFWTPIGISWSRNTIEMDIDDTSMGFRILRRHGYDISADVYYHFEKNGQFYCFVGQTNQGITEMLSLYRASQVLFPNEKILEEAKNFSCKFLREKQALGEVADRWLITKDLAGEVKYYLDVPWYANLPRIETRHYIDQYGGYGDLWLAKVLYRMHKVSNNLYLELAKSDYNHCQKLHQVEWIGMQKWYEMYNLKYFGISKDDLLKLYFIPMSSIFEPEQATERLAWAQTAALIKIVSLYFKVNSNYKKTAFIKAFNRYQSTDSGIGSNGTRNKLVDITHKTLSNISSNVQETHGKEVYHHLISVWNTWLLKLKTDGDHYHVPDDEAELLVNTINLCAGHSYTTGLMQQSEYVHLVNLTNDICNYLHQTENSKVGSENICVRLESIDVQMQELVQNVVKNDDGVDQEIKQNFLAVAKGYYYAAYCEPTTVDNHIAKVLFEQVV